MPPLLPDMANPPSNVDSPRYRSDGTEEEIRFPDPEVLLREEYMARYGDPSREAAEERGGSKSKKGKKAKGKAKRVAETKSQGCGRSNIFGTVVILRECFHDAGENHVGVGEAPRLGAIASNYSR